MLNLNVVGNIISATGTMANINSLRYRGYYYDADTGLYYLQSRYYDPVTGRFINADDMSNLGADGELNGYNLYAYCGNNPVNCSDETGCFALPNWAKLAIGGVAFAGAVTLTYLTGGAMAPIFIGIGTSIVTGGVIQGAMSSIRGEGFWNGFVDGISDGAMWGGIFALGGATVRAIRYYSAINNNDYATLAKLFTHNKLSNKVMLGKYDGGGTTSYIAKAGYTHTYFKMPSRIFNKLSINFSDDIWLINQSFLDQQIGKTFCFSHPIKNATGYFAREIAYLISKGVI